MERDRDRDRDRDRSFKLEELAREAEVSPRTVRYYVQRGLLPAPVFKGRDTAYSAEHLLRLRAIKRLQERFLPLDAIQAELERRSAAELEELAAAEPAQVVVTGGRPALPPPPPPPAPAPARRAEPKERWTRWVLAPGLELHLSDRADTAAADLADAIMALGERRKGR